MFNANLTPVNRKVSDPSKDCSTTTVWVKSILIPNSICCTFKVPITTRQTITTTLSNWWSCCRYSSSWDKSSPRPCTTESLLTCHWHLSFWRKCSANTIHSMNCTRSTLSCTRTSTSWRITLATSRTWVWRFPWQKICFWAKHFRSISCPVARTLPWPTKTSRSTFTWWRISNLTSKSANKPNCFWKASRNWFPCNGSSYSIKMNCSGWLAVTW